MSTLERNAQGPAVIYEPAIASSGVGRLVLNRPDERNGMTPELLDAFRDAIDLVHQDVNLRALVLTGTGTCFSAGANLRGQLQREEGVSARLPNEASFAMYTAFLRLLEVAVPVVGALNGHAVGGGFGLALLCDVRVAAEEGRYGANFTRIGLHPGLGITYSLTRLIGLERASELLYTGRLVGGVEAAALGIAAYAAESGQVLAKAQALAEEIAKAAPLAVRATKATLRRRFAIEVTEAARAEAFAQAETVASADFAEGMAAFFEKRSPQFGGR